MSESIGTIPQSGALGEARVESISELLSINPLVMTPAQRSRLIADLREQRKRWEIAEAAGKPARASKSAGASAKTLLTDKTIAELDL